MMRNILKSFLVWGITCNVSLTACATKMPPGKLTIAAVDPLVKVMRSDALPQNTNAVADVARGEVASLQFAVKSASAINGLKASISVTPALTGSVRFVGYVKVTSFAKDAASDKIVSADGMYPDPLLEDAQIDVPANSNQPIWLSVPVPANAKPGNYQGKLMLDGVIDGAKFHEERPFVINVYPVQLKTPDLWISMFPSMENPRLGGMTKKLSLMNSGKSLDLFSDQYFVLLKDMANMMHDYYQNVIMVYPMHTIVYTPGANGKINFDFTVLDKQIQIFRNAGIKRIEGSFLGGRNGGWWDPFSLFFYSLKNGKYGASSGDLNNKELVEFYKQYIPALVNHLKEKGWYKDYYQHIADEPIDNNSNSWNEYYRFVKQLAPDLKVIESIQTTRVDKGIDILVPIMDFLEKNYDYYRNLQNTGKEVWSYVCWQPQKEYANRFVELPLIKTRLLPWINYRYDLNGYLHWAYNGWNDNPLELANNAKDALPAGDRWIVYPGNGKLLSSIRLEALRDGIVDYTLLEMLGSTSQRKSNAMAARIVHSFSSYETDINKFRASRVELLKALSH